MSYATYQVVATTNWSASSVTISGVITATGPTTTFLDIAETNAAKFYRVKVVQ